MDANKGSLQQQLNQYSMWNGCQQSLFVATAQPVFNVEWMPTKSLCSNSSTSIQCGMVPTKSLCSNSSTSVQCRTDTNKVSLQQQLNQCSVQNGCQQSLFIATAQPVFNVERMPTKSLCSNSSTNVEWCQQSLFVATAQPVFSVEWMPQSLFVATAQPVFNVEWCQQSLFVATAQPVFNVEWMPTKSLCSNSSTSVQYRMDANKVSLQQQLNQCSMQNGCQQSLFVATAQSVFNIEWMPTKSLCSNSSTSVQCRMVPTKSLCSNSSTSFQCGMDANKVSLQQQLNQCSMQNGCQQSLFVATAQPVFNVEWMPTKSLYSNSSTSVPTKSLCSNSSTSVQCRMDANKVSLQQQLSGLTKSLCSNSSTSVLCRMVPTKSLCSNSSTSVQCRMDANKVSLQQQLNQCSMQNGCLQSLFVATVQPVFNVEWMPTKSLCSNSSTSVQCRMDANKVSLQQQLNQCSMQNGCQQSVFVATAQSVFNAEWMPNKAQPVFFANKVSLQQQLNSVQCRMDANKVSLQQHLNQFNVECQQSLFVATAQPVFNVEWMPTKSLCSNSSTSVQCRRIKGSLRKQLNQCSTEDLFVATAQPVFNVEWMPTKSLCSNSSTSVQCRMDANKVSLQQQLNQCSMQNGCQQSLFVATVQPVFNIEWMPTKSLCSNSSTSVQCRMDANKVSLQQQLNQCSMQNGCQQSLFSNSSTSVQCELPTKSLCSNSSTRNGCQQIATAQPVFNVEWMPTKSLCSNSSTSVQCRMDANKVSLQQQLNQCSMQNGCQQSLFVATAQPVCCQQNVEWMPTKSLCSNSSTSVQCRMDANKVSLQQQLNQCSIQNGCQQSLFVATAQPVFNVEWMPTKSLCSNSSTSVQCRMDANKVSLQQQLNQCSMQNGCQQSLFVATAQPVFNVEWMPTKCSTSVQCRMDANKVSLQQQLNQCSMQNGCQQSLFVATAQPVFNVEWMPTKSLCSNSSTSVQCRMDANKVSLQQQLNQCSMQNGCQQSLFVATAQPVFSVEWMPTKSLSSNSSISVQCRMDANKVSLQQQLNQCSMQNGCQQSLFVATAQPVFMDVEWMPTKSLCSNSSTSVQCRMDAYKVSLQQQLNQCSMQNGCLQSLFVATAQSVFSVEWMPTKSLCSNSSTSVQYRMDANKVSLQQQLNQCSMQNGYQQSLFVATAQPVFNIEWMPTKSLCSNSSTSVQYRMDANKVSLQQQLNQGSMQNGCQQSLFVATAQPVFNIEWMPTSLFVATAQPVFNIEWMPTKSLCSKSSTSVQCRMDANKVSLQQQFNQCSIQNGCQQSLFVATAQPVFNVEWMPTKSLSSNSSTSGQYRMDANKVSLQQQLNQCSMQNGCQQSLFVATAQPVFNVEWCQQSLFIATAQPVFNVEWCQQSLFVATSQPVFNVEWMPTKSLCSNSSTSVLYRMDTNKVSLQQQLNQCSMQNGCLQSLFVATAQPVFNVEWMPTKCLCSNSSTSVQCRMVPTKSLSSNSSTSVQYRMVPTKSLSSNISTSVQCRMDAYKVSLQQQLNQCSIQNGCQQSLFVATAQPVFNVEWCQQSLFLATSQPVFNVEWMPTKSLCSNSSTSVQCRMDAYKVSLQQQLNQCSIQNGYQQSLFVATAQSVFSVEWMPTKSLCSNSSTSVQCRMDTNKVSLQQQLNQCSMQNGANKVSLQQQLNQCSVQNG